jgi:hypothetical protein
VGAVCVDADRKLTNGLPAVGAGDPENTASAQRVATAEALAGAGVDQVGVIVFFLQIDTLAQKNSNRDKHLQNRLLRPPRAFGAD